MSYLQSDIPFGPIYCWLRSEYLYGGVVPQGEPSLYQCQLIGLRSQRGRAIGFHVLLENGACWAPPAIPLSALVHDANQTVSPKAVEHMDLVHLQAWDCFGDHFSAHRFDALPDCVWARLPHTKAWSKGRYLFTVDWTDNGYSETPWQHKQGHVIALDSGHFCMVPNNYLCWNDPSFTDPFINTGRTPKFTVNRRVYSVEDAWVVESGENDEVFYTESES
jgi:hypothetical protein